jgi:acyl-coenzyme A synthetase/AMP-(fatty) acid ligase
VEFRTQLPKTRLGKIDYRVLVAEHVEKVTNVALMQGPDT